jgi:hypothetical protein
MIDLAAALDLALRAAAVFGFLALAAVGVGALLSGRLRR